MAEGSLPYVEQFNAHEDIASVGVRWIKWLKRFEDLLIALNRPQEKTACSVIPLCW